MRTTIPLLGSRVLVSSSNLFGPPRFLPKCGFWGTKIGTRRVATLDDIIAIRCMQRVSGVHDVLLSIYYFPVVDNLLFD